MKGVRVPCRGGRLKRMVVWHGKARQVGPLPLEFVMTTLGRIWEQLRPTGVRFSRVGAIGEFEVRAAIPGVDPARDIRIWLSGAVLRVEVTRTPTRDDRIRSEFHYGRSIGAVGLPRDVDGRHLLARYHRGVLTIASEVDSMVGSAVPIGSGPTSR